MKMEPDTLEALEESILKWERIVRDYMKALYEFGYGSPEARREAERELAFLRSLRPVKANPKFELLSEPSRAGLWFEPVSGRDETYEMKVVGPLVKAADVRDLGRKMIALFYRMENDQ